MFDFVRNHTKLVLGALLLLIIPSFVFFGVEGYTSFRDGSNAPVAKVDGQSITRGEWEQAHQRFVERVRRQNPEQAQGLDTPEFRKETLEALLRERVLATAARDQHLAPTDARLQRLFVNDPQFAAVRNPDGSVNRELLGMQGMTSEMFAQNLRLEFASQQVLGGVSRTALLPPAMAERALDALLQRRAVQAQRFDAQAYRAKVSVSDADIEAFYKAEPTRFRAPEQAEIEYVLLELDALSKGVQVGEDEARKFYADNQARFGSPEERRASHVLIKAGADASAADKAKAKARAEELLAQVRKAPTSFAAVARQHSQDAGSAAQGGDLDFFGRGAMVKAFETAAFSLKPGEISDVFETEFGYHFLTVTGVRGGQVKAFDEVRPQIEAELRTAKARSEWAKAAETFTNTVYEQSDSLQPVIDKLKLAKQVATVQRAAAPGTPAHLAAPKFLDAIFGNEAVANKRNTDAVEVAPNRLIAGRVVKHMPARTRELAEVKEQARAELVNRRALEMARQEGQARVAALKAAPGETLPITLQLSRLQSQGAPRSLIDAVMGADATKLPYVTGVDLGAGGYVVVKVTEVLPREAGPGGDAPLRAQFVQALAAAEGDAVLATLKARYKAEIKAGASMASDAASAPAR
jgi:peptidyl-prolyl cis-trans isomerase D